MRAMPFLVQVPSPLVPFDERGRWHALRSALLRSQVADPQRLPLPRSTPDPQDSPGELKGTDGFANEIIEDVEALVATSIEEGSPYSLRPTTPQNGTPLSMLNFVDCKHARPAPPLEKLPFSPT